MHFSWELSGSGWATCRIWDGSTKHRDIVSYCTNALADLLKGVTGLYGLHGIQRFSFDLEPAEARWILRRRNNDVHIPIRRFPDLLTSSLRRLHLVSRTLFRASPGLSMWPWRCFAAGTR
ncbi:hypothetical protein [Streptomyces sp. W1SF4]|uniref:hypothetical protein n=1 Tax=Streptomyces sp. W1SF4 TaxID=2305220 RepID=UPI0019D2E1A8|nr:hypothetical protein [Streptomyces sp. W1SF4]